MDWTTKEVKHTVNIYFEMLQFELKHLKFNKTDYRKQLIPFLNNRSHGAIELKHQNISAVLAKLGLPYIKGYKPRSHYQQILESQVVSFLENHKGQLEKEFKMFADEIIPEQSTLKIDFKRMLDKSGPKRSKLHEKNIIDKEPTYRPIKINYLEKEQNNRFLGQQGEELIIEYEKWRLTKAGKKSLANRIKWVSKELGDGTGYDILSKNENGSDRYIEVKTTKLSKETPIYLTKTEISFAKRPIDFYLYRVFNWGTDPRFFIKHGAYDSFCSLQPLSYKGIF